MYVIAKILDCTKVIKIQNPVYIVTDMLKIKRKPVSSGSSLPNPFQCVFPGLLFSKPFKDTLETNQSITLMWH